MFTVLLIMQVPPRFFLGQLVPSSPPPANSWVSSTIVKPAWTKVAAANNTWTGQVLADTTVNLGQLVDKGDHCDYNEGEVKVVEEGFKSIIPGVLDGDESKIRSKRVRRILMTDQELKKLTTQDKKNKRKRRRLFYPRQMIHQSHT